MKRLDMADQVLSLLSPLQDSINLETVAISSLAQQKINRSGQRLLIEKQIRFLLSHQGSPNFWSNQDIIATALSNYFGQTQFSVEDYQLKILVNGKQVYMMKLSAKGRRNCNVE